MARKNEQMNKLEEELERLDKQIEALMNQRLGVARALALLRGDVPQAVVGAQSPPRARNVKETVLTLLQEAGERGLGVADLLERALQRNIHLERGTVSSMLSRLKREGVLEFRDGRYSSVLAKEAPNTGSLHPH